MIHPTAVVDKHSEIADDVDIGPYCVVGEKVFIGRGTKLASHVCVEGRAEIGENCTVSPFASIGSPPQDLTYKDEDTAVIIGNQNVIKEYVTINRGTPSGEGATRVGDGNFIMAYAHIAHDCHVGNHVIMANCATLAGHVEVFDSAILGGLCAVHQFCRIGTYAFISGLTGVPKDVPPFTMAAGNRARLYGLNVVGLERRGFSKEEVAKLKKAYRILFRSSLSLAASLKMIEEELEGPNIAELINFVRSAKRGICR